MRDRYFFILLYSVCLLDVLTPSNGVSQQHSKLLPCQEEEITLLSESLLKLGSEFKSEATRTQQNLTRIFKQMDLFNVSLGKIFRQVLQTARQGEDLDAKTRSFTLNNTIQQSYAELNKELTLLKAQGLSLDSKIKPLERKIRKAVNIMKQDHSFPNITTILSLIKSQRMQIEELMHMVNIHQDLIDTQEAKIQNLLNKTRPRKMATDGCNEDLNQRLPV